jgi:hypothetical protein
MALFVTATVVLAMSITAGARPSLATKTSAKKKTTSTVNVTSQRVLAIPAAGLAEVSGCAVSRRDPDVVWLHNDADDGAIVVPVNTKTRVVGSAVTLSGVTVADPEDIAVAPNGDVVLADIGDNREMRSTVQLVRFPEPAPRETRAEAEVMTLLYPDRAHNAEAFVIDPETSFGYIITKDRSGAGQVFRADLAGVSEQELVLVGTITISGESGRQPNVITAADLAVVDGRPVVVLRTFSNGYSLASSRPTSVEDLLLTAKPRRFDLPAMPQAEALCVSADGRTMVTASESQGAATFPLAVVAMSRALVV